MNKVKYITKKGKEIVIVDLTKKYTDQLRKHINEIVDENAYLHSTKHITKKEIQKMIALQRKGVFIEILALHNDKVVGEGSINNNFAERFANRAEVGITVKKEYRGEGVGAILMNELIKRAKSIKNKKYKIRMLFLVLFSGNRAAYNLYKKFGFKVYGRLPRSLYKDGRYHDEIGMFRFL